MKEETGLKIRNLKYRGNMTIEYPNRIFDFDVFICNECEGKTQNFEENTSEWIEINELLKKEKILSNIMILDRLGYGRGMLFLCICQVFPFPQNFLIFCLQMLLLNLFCW